MSHIGFRSIKLAVLKVQTFILVRYCSLYASKNDKRNVCSDNNVETTLCKSVIHSSDMVKLPTHLMSDVCTFGIDLMFRKIILVTLNNLDSTLLLN